MKTVYKRPEWKSFPFNRIFEHSYGYKRWKYLFSLYKNPILFLLVNLYLYFDWQNNRGLFKSGDYIVYNWKARVVLGDKFVSGKANRNGRILFRIGGYELWSSAKENVFFDHDHSDGCSGFWIRLATKKEIVTLKTPDLL